MRRFADTPWGCFRTIVFTPLQPPCSDTAPPAYLSQNTTRYGHRSPAILVRSDRLDAGLHAGVNFALTAF